MSNYDAIIIGGGIAGTTAGAFLGKHGKKVLVLEQCTQLGGRATSFRGEGIKDVKAHKKTLANAAWSWVHDRCEPSFEEMVENHLMDGYVFESGARGSWRANRGRVSRIAYYFNKCTNMFGNVRFVGIGVDGDYTAKNKTGWECPQWMTQEDFAETMKVTMKLLAHTETSTSHEYDHVTLKEVCESLTSNEKALEWHYNRCTFHTVINDPAMNTFGEDIRVSLILREDPNVTHDFGCWGFHGAPGHRQLSESMADVIEQYGGTVIKDAKVAKIIINNGTAEGVIVLIDGKEQTIKAPIVLNTVPIIKLHTLLDIDQLDEPFQIAAKRTSRSGCLSMYIGMKKPLNSFALKPYDGRAFFWCPKVAPKEAGFTADIPLVGADLGLVAPTRCPEGKHLIASVANLMDFESSDPAKVNLVIDGMYKFYDKAYPGWRDEMEFVLILVNNAALLWRHPQDDAPPVKSEKIKGLYFAGDAYSQMNCGGIEGASQSAMLCVEEILGINIRDEVLGPIMGAI